MADGDEPPQRVEIEAGGDTSAATFTLHNEDHTIGARHPSPEPRMPISPATAASARPSHPMSLPHASAGNSLRYVLNKDPQVSFVGYSVPHPSEPKMNLRIQTVGPSATTVLHGALGAAPPTTKCYPPSPDPTQPYRVDCGAGTLYEITAHTKETFERALEDFKAKQER